jgi:hypothetical protein
MFEFLYKFFNRKTTYKCVAYVDEDPKKDKIVDAFEIQEYSLKGAYKVADEVLKLKYPGTGIDIRIYTK